MHPQEKFKLTKWYFDCVSESGETVIVYSAIARWRRLTLHYSSVLHLGHDGQVSSRSSVRPFPLPSGDSRMIKLLISPLGVEGEWRGEEESLARTVLDSDTGRIEWRCLQPRSRARVHIPGHAVIEGLGYAECLEMTIPPWELPLKELHWGRFLSPEHSLIWIDWRGPYNRQFVFHNLIECSAQDVSECGFSIEGGSLLLDRGQTLRNGLLGDTILPGTPTLRKMFPIALFNILECKWRSQGILRIGDQISTGWAIHEVVQWGKQ